MHAKQDTLPRYEVQMFNPIECRHFGSEQEALAFWSATHRKREPIARDLLTNEVLAPVNPS